MKGPESAPVLSVIAKKEQKSLCDPPILGIKKEDLSGEVVGVIRRIYSNVTGKDITRKSKTLSPRSSRADFRFHPQSLRNAISWGRNVEHITGSPFSTETRLFVDYDLRSDLVSFRLEPGQGTSENDRRGEMMKNKFDRMVNRYLQRKGLI